MKKYIYIPLFLAVLIVASAERSYACSCVVTPEPLKKQIQNSYSGADAVFSGEVVEIKESPTDKYSVIVKFKVADSWKGELSQEIMVTTAKDSAMCGYSFEVGKKYLVYASGLPNNLSAYNCSRTAVFSPKGDVKYLAKLKRKKPVVNKLL